MVSHDQCTYKNVLLPDWLLLVNHNKNLKSKLESGLSISNQNLIGSPPKTLIYFFHVTKKNCIKKDIKIDLNLKDEINTFKFIFIILRSNAS